jgi:hypothetical protein
VGGVAASHTYSPVLASSSFFFLVPHIVFIGQQSVNDDDFMAMMTWLQA